MRVEKKNAIYNNNLMRIRTINSVKPDFILQQICDLSFKERMENIKRATTNVAAIYAKDLMPLPLAMPSEKEQAKIMSLVDHQFSVIEKLDDEIKKRLIHSQSLRQSILKIAFEGKLVPQDPNDEPASVLLERIKAKKTKLKN